MLPDAGVEMATSGIALREVLSTCVEPVLISADMVCSGSKDAVVGAHTGRAADALPDDEVSDGAKRSAGSSIFITVFHPRVRRLLSLCELGAVEDTADRSTMPKSFALRRLGDLDKEAVTTGSSATDWSSDLRFRCKVLIRRRNV